MNYYIDIQGFRDDANNFIVKELGISHENEFRPMHYIFEEPCPHWEYSLKTRITNRYLSNHLHGLPWHFGDVPYNKLKDILSSLEASRIYVKGLEKKRVIEKYVDCIVIDLSYGPSISNMYKDDVSYSACPLRHSQFNCAFQNCQAIRLWHQTVTFDYDSEDSS